MLDEHTRLLLLNIVERSITADRLVAELDKTFALWGGPPQVLRMDNGPEFFPSPATVLCRSGRLSGRGPEPTKGGTDTTYLEAAAGAVIHVEQMAVLAQLSNLALRFGLDRPGEWLALG